MCVITLRKVPRILTPFYLNPDYLKFSLPRPNYRSFFPSVSESDSLFSRCRSSSSSMFHSRALVQASSQPDVEAKVQKSEKSSIRFFSALSRPITASSVLPSPPLISVSSCHLVPSGRVSIRVSLFPRVECRRSPIVPLAAGGAHPRHPPRLSFACCRSGVLLRHRRAVSLS